MTHAPPDQMAAFRMKIGGMSCSFCTATIDKAYGRIDGVFEVGVSLAHEEGLIKYDPSKVTPEKLRRTLEDMGYTYRDPEKLRSFDEDGAELRREGGRLVVAATFTVVSLLLMLFGQWLAIVEIPLMPWLLLTLALNTMFVTGWFVKRMAWASLRRGILNQHVLLEFAAFAGIAGGFLGLFVLENFPVGDFFAASTLVTTYHILSHYASLVVRTRSSQAVRRLMELRPDTARVVRNGEEIEVPIDDVVAGDQVRIRPGESIPVDGTVEDGVSAVNEAIVTGESMPVEKVPGDEVIGGSINQTGTLIVTVTRVGDEAFLSQVAKSIDEARSLRPGVLQVVDVVLRYFAPTVLIFATGGFLVWSIIPALVGDGPNWNRALLAGLASLVMGYPCALGMATPLATIRGGGEAAQRGILMRSGEAFQVMGNTAFIVFDKTGTITRGEPTVHTVLPAAGVDPDEVLRVAASAEMNSEHPLARAVEDEAGARKLELLDTTAFESHTGQGIEATLDGAIVLVGKPTWMVSQGVGLGVLDDDRERLESEGQTVIAVSRDGWFLGLIGIADTIKSHAIEAIARVKDAGITPVMITGDNARTASTVAAQVGIDDVLAEVLPAGKAAEIRRLQETGKRVMMVGDGINDAPALTQADIGVAIGAGTDIAIESADIVIMSDRLGSVMDAHSIGVSSYRKTKQNLVLAFSFNGIGVLAAVSGLVSPVWAMIAMISSVTAVLANSFGGQLLRGETLNTRFQSATQDDHHGDSDEPENADSFRVDRTPLADVRIDGHTVRMWAGVATAITTLTLLAGTWQT